MPFSDEYVRLRPLAVLYLSVAHRSVDVLDDATLEFVTWRLLGRCGNDVRPAVRSAVEEALEHLVATGDAAETVRRAARELHDGLAEDERREVLNDLVQIARTDGATSKHERAVLRSVATIWGVSITGDAEEVDVGPWGVLHDLAYIFVVLAQGTDSDLSGTEMHVMVNKLREWLPHAPRDDVQSMLRLAMREYAEEQDEEHLEAAISSVRSALPREQRMAALNDLVKIANADGVFLDVEEDLINHLQTEWEIDPSANYEPHGDKGVDA